MLDKLDYCASLRNLDSVSHLPNLKVSLFEYFTPFGVCLTTRVFLMSHFQFVKGDIMSTDLVLHLLKEDSIDTIINFAAQVRV